MSAFSIALQQLLMATAIEMTPPQSYGPFHLTFALVGFALSVLLAWSLRRIGHKWGRVLIFGLGLFLLCCEAYKQLFYYFCIDEVGYKWWIFPFHLCSVPMYFCLVAPLLRPGRLSSGMYNFMAIFNLLGGFITFFEPSGINLSYWGLTLHAYTWHMMLVFIGLFLNFSGFAGRRMQDFRAAALTFVALCAVAFCINVALREVSQGSVNMFFVGPSDSSLVVFKDIAKHCGWYVSTLLYIPAVCLGAFLIFLPSYLYGRRKSASLHNSQQSPPMLKI